MAIGIAGLDRLVAEDLKHLPRQPVLRVIGDRLAEDARHQIRHAVEQPAHRVKAAVSRTRPSVASDAAAARATPTSLLVPAVVVQTLLVSSQ